MERRTASGTSSGRVNRSGSSARTARRCHATRSGWQARPSHSPSCRCSSNSSNCDAASAITERATSSSATPGRAAHSSTSACASCYAQPRLVRAQRTTLPVDGLHHSLRSPLDASRADVLRPLRSREGGSTTQPMGEVLHEEILCGGSTGKCGEVHCVKVAYRSCWECDRRTPPASMPPDVPEEEQTDRAPLLAANHGVAAIRKARQPTLAELPIMPKTRPLRVLHSSRRPQRPNHPRSPAATASPTRGTPPLPAPAPRSSDTPRRTRSCRRARR
jgi:hypothetical protein